MKDDPIDELHRLNEEFAKLLNGQEKPVSEKTTVEQLVRQYGLTTKEAENWLRNEPDFVPSDGSYHDKRPDDKLPEPARATPPKP